MKGAQNLERPGNAIVSLLPIANGQPIRLLQPLRSAKLGVVFSGYGKTMKLTSLAFLPDERVSHNPAIQKKVMLRSGDLPYLTNFSQARFAPNQVAAAHAHQDMCEVFFVESGQGLIKIDGQEYPLEAGVCVAVEVGETHEIVNNGSTDLVLTYFGLQVETIK